MIECYNKNKDEKHERKKQKRKRKERENGFKRTGRQERVRREPNENESEKYATTHNKCHQLTSRCGIGEVCTIPDLFAYKRQFVIASFKICLKITKQLYTCASVYRRQREEKYL